MQNNASLLTILSLSFMTYSHIEAMDPEIKKNLGAMKQERTQGITDSEREARRKAALEALRNRPSGQMVKIEQFMERILSGEEPNMIFTPGSQTIEQMTQTLMHNSGSTIMTLPSRDGVSKSRVLGMPIVGPIMLLTK